MPSELDIVFTPGLKVTEGVRVVREVATLQLTDGKLVATDPYSLWETPRLVLDVPSGPARVSLAMVRLFGIHEVAAARVDFGKRRAMRWRKTKRVLPVDGASACFCTPAAAARFHDDLDASSALALRIGTRKPWTTRAGLVAFATHDDGGYRIVRGVDARGQLAAIAVMFSRTAL